MSVCWVTLWYPYENKGLIHWRSTRGAGNIPGIFPLHAASPLCGIFKLFPNTDTPLFKTIYLNHYKNIYRLSQTILDYLELSLTISYYLLLSLTIFDYIGLSGTFWDYFGLSGTIWDYLGLYGTIWDYLGLSGGTIWDYLGPSWTRVQAEAGETKLLLFETFSWNFFFHLCHS